MRSVFVNVEGPQYLGGWRPETGALFLPTLSDSRVGEVVAVRVGIYGQAIRATLFGKVALVRRVGRPALPPGVELALDKASLPAAGFLAAAARGEPVSFRERAPRYGAERRVTASHGREHLVTTTLNLSEGGCALRWTGPLPLVGDVLSLRLGDGLFASSVRAVVCWNQPGGAVERSVGVRVIAAGRPGKGWRALLASVVQAGARES